MGRDDVPCIRRFLKMVRTIRRPSKLTFCADRTTSFASPDDLSGRGVLSLYTTAGMVVGEVEGVSTSAH
jgi:hypothetical protein